MKLTIESQSSGRENYSSATLFNTNPIWSSLGSNLHCRCYWPMTDCVIQGSVASNLNRLETTDFISWKRNTEESYEVEMWTFEYV